MSETYDAQPVAAPEGTVAPAPAVSTATDEAGWTPDPNEPAPEPNLAVGIAAGTALGVLAALVYAGVAIFADREFLALGLLIGLAIAFGFHRFGHTRGILPGLIAAVIAAVLFFVAIFITGAGAVAKIAEVSFIDGLRFVTENSGDFLSAYFEDPLSYVFLGVSVVMAGYYAFGGRGAKK